MRPHHLSCCGCLFVCWLLCRLINPEVRARCCLLTLGKLILCQLCHDDVYIELPSEAECAADECGKLTHWIYGCRKAVQAWEDHHSRVLCDGGFERGVASPVALHHKTREMWCVVHGDDFSFVGFEEDLDFIEQLLSENYEVKIRGRLGPKM